MSPQRKKLCLIQGQTKLQFKVKSSDEGVSGMNVSNIDIFDVVRL